MHHGKSFQPPCGPPYDQYHPSLRLCFLTSKIQEQRLLLEQPLKANCLNKMASKWDKELASDICEWIERGIGVIVPSENPEDFAKALKDGQTLCNLANEIKPGSIKKINTKKMPFFEMENIGWFSEFVTAYGVQKEYGFVTVDLYEERNVPQVLIALKWLKTQAEKGGFKF